MSLLHQIALACIPGIGPVLARALLSHCGNAEEVFKLKKSELSQIQGIGPKSIESIIRHDVFARAEREMEFIERFHIQTFFLNEDTYPKRLRNCADAPIMLYFKGEADLNIPRIISVVGARNSSEYGREICRNLIADLKVFDPLIVSGLAYGIDATAHKESIKNGLSTVGVMAHGLDRIYPESHRAMALKMLDNGGLITEFLSSTIPDRENFPKRNRIIAGLSDITIVVEASIKGGALITAELANSYNRDVFAFPGRINDEFSAGCNHLIKTNRANLITRLNDIEYIMGWAKERVTEVRQQLSLLLDLTDDEQKIADVLQQNKATSIDELSYHTNFKQSKLTLILLGMEMKGLLHAMPGNTYRLV